MVFLKNQKLFDLYQNLVEAENSILVEGGKIPALERKLKKIKVGHPNYNEAARQYEDARAATRRAFGLAESLRQDLELYALDHCVPVKYRNKATVECALPSDHITITYYADEELKEFVLLRLYFDDSNL